MKDQSEMSAESRGSLRTTAATVCVHAGIVMLHGVAHAQLHVALSTSAQVFVAVVIAIAPLVGLVLLKRGNRLAGAAILATAMAASLVFGTWNHFFVPGDDHVAHLSRGSWRLPFQSTAGLLAVTEGIGRMLALKLLRSQTRGETRTEPQPRRTEKGEAWPTRYSKS